MPVDLQFRDLLYRWRRLLPTSLTELPSHLPALPVYVLLAALLTLAPLAAMNALLFEKLEFTTYASAHLLLEIITTALALMIFMLAWSTRHDNVRMHFKVIGVMFLYIAILNTAHLLTFPGMPGFNVDEGMQRTLGFWIPVQLLTALTLLIAALMPAHDTARSRSASAIRVLTWMAMPLTLAILWVGSFHPAWMPLWWTPEKGLTPVKIGAELIVSLALLAIALLLARRAGRQDHRQTRTSYVLLFWAALLLGVGTLSFTLYASMNELVALFGHVYRVAAFLLIYEALFVKGVRLPYARLAESERRLEDSRRRYRTLFQSSPDGVLLVDRSGRVRNANPAVLAMFGHSPESLIGHSVDILLPPHRQTAHALYRQGFTDQQPPHARTMAQNKDLTGMRRDGRVFPVEVALVPLEGYADNDLTIMCIVRDVTQSKELEQQLKHQATHDALTGLPNRTLFADRLEHAKIRAQRSGLKVAVLFLDLDHFKKVNDSLGHATGDLLLKQATERLHSALRAEDTIARVGGDEFMILLQDLSEDVDVALIAEKSIDTLTRPFHLAGREIHIGASIGITIFPSDATESPELLRNADIALYAAKDAGRNTFRFFSADMDRQARERLTLEQNLREAIANQALRLHYQPQVTPDGRIVGAEALLRWEQDGRMIPPDQFIKMAEETSLILPIGSWVLQTACRQARDWDAAGLKLERMAVNVSSRQFRQHDFAAQVRAALEASGWPAARLELEITESIIMDAPEQAAKMLEELRDLGVSIAVDDFGTGYSSLAYLKLFHVDHLKIDRSFIRDLADDENDAAIVNAVISMAHALGLSVVAEGVETEQQRQWLTRHGCHMLQGWLFGKAVPAEQFALAYRNAEPA